MRSSITCIAMVPISMQGLVNRGKGQAQQFRIPDIVKSDYPYFLWNGTAQRVEGPHQIGRSQIVGADDGCGSIGYNSLNKFSVRRLAAVNPSRIGGCIFLRR